jgi:hypothetical protein
MTSRKMIRHALVSALALACAAGVAFADNGTGVRVRPAGLTGPITAGVPATLDFTIDADHATTLSNFRMTTPRAATGVGPVVTGLPASLTLAVGTPATVHVNVTSPSDDALLQFSFTENGHTQTEYFDLSRKHFDRMHRPQQAVGLFGIAQIPFDPAGDTDPGAGPPVAALTHDRPVKDVRAQLAGAKQADAHNVHVTGRVVCWRFVSPNNDGIVYLGADHVRVRVFDQNTFADEMLFEGRTDADGNFDWTFPAGETKPDLYVEVATINGAVNVQDGTWNSVYSFESSVHVDYAGSSLNFGTLSASDLYMNYAMHMHNTVTRTWRWWHAHTSIATNMQAVEWPSGSWAHYDPFGGDLHIPEYINGVPDYSQVKSEGTVSHEYGHSIMSESFNYIPPYNYDNGICNRADGSPGHCQWCEEDGGVAVSEGFANYVADMTTRDFASLYGTAPYLGRDTEAIQQCTQNGPAYDADAFITEGHFGSLLRDLTDFEDETDPAALKGGRDLIHLDVGPVVAILNAFHPNTPAQYIQSFRASHPEIAPYILWGTLANDRYLLTDSNAPALVTNVTSTDHVLNTPSPDATIAIGWSPTTDDFSGVDHYEAQYGPSTSGPWKNATYTDWFLHKSYVNIFGNFAFTPALAVGSYYVRVRALDRAGNANAYVMNGPYVIRAPLPADMTPQGPAGWAGAVVPRDAAGATSTSCAVGTVLPPNSPGTYLNLSMYNAGESAASKRSWGVVKLDGVPIDSTQSLLTGSHSFDTFVNRAGFTVRGGLHTLELVVDAHEELEEPNEINNDDAIQYNWLAQPVSLNTRVRRPAPPDPLGGDEGIPLFVPRYSNCDGLSYTQFRVFPPLNVPFAGMWVAALDTTENYDVSLHAHSSSTADGFRTRLANSGRPAGELDAVLTNTRLISASAYDVGVVNTSGGTHDYIAGVASAPTTALVAGDSVVITMADSTMMALRDLNLSSTSPLAVQIQVTSGTATVYATWLSNTFAQGTISDFNAKTATGANGSGELHVVPAATGIHELVFYRHPRDGFGAVTFTVHIVPLRADVTPALPAGWAASLVPRPAADATAANVPAPTLLAGDANSTWLNLAIRNQSDAAAGFLNTGRYVDRTNLGNQLFIFAANQTLTAINSGPFTVNAGRHVLSVTADPTNVMPELDETNNRTGRQWVWAPPVSPLSTTLWRAGTNGSPTEGWDAVDSTQTPDFDADGIRTPTFTSGTTAGWAAIAVTPRAGSDVDLQLHELAPTASKGFEDPLAFSAWDGDATELMLIDFGATTYRGFDVGVLRAANDTASYSAEIVPAVLRGTGISGPFTLGAGHLLHLHALDLAAGHHIVDVVNQTGTVDWGAAAYGGPRPYQSRSDGDDLASAYLAPAGASEHLEFDVPVTGRYAIAVYKTGASERDKSGTYALAVDKAWADVAPQVSETRMQGARPSPFVAQTQLEWSLAQDGDADVSVYDVRGARVRTLAHGHAAAGAHTLAWSGDDDAGHALAPGLYFVRLATQGREDTSRIVITR